MLPLAIPCAQAMPASKEAGNRVGRIFIILCCARNASGFQKGIEFLRVSAQTNGRTGGSHAQCAGSSYRGKRRSVAAARRPQTSLGPEDPLEGVGVAPETACRRRGRRVAQARKKKVERSRSDVAFAERLLRCLDARVQMRTVNASSVIGSVGFVPAEMAMVRVSRIPKLPTDQSGPVVLRTCNGV